MDNQLLMMRGFDLASFRLGTPQRSGAMTVAPLFGPDSDGAFSAPLSGLKLSGVRGYGNVELSNPSPSGVAIVPLHIGYIQHAAQNHALCSAAFIAAGQKRMFDDACCVQAAQGGYLVEREQWFFILPLELRNEALQLRGKKSYGKLWEAISRLNQRFSLPSRGHLEQILTKQRAYLTQYQSRFELLPAQTGAMFFLRGKLAGIEIAPSAAYFQEVWMPLVCFCYGAAAMHDETRADFREPTPTPFPARNLQELRAQLRHSRQALEKQVSDWLARTPHEKFRLQEEERFLNLRLLTVTGNSFAGQVVEDGGRLVYASLFAKPEYISRN